MHQAAEFYKNNLPYMFEDAHFLVEAQASQVAKELVHNIFQFPDGSILKMGQFSAQTFANLEAAGLAAVHM